MDDTINLVVIKPEVHSSVVNVSLIKPAKNRDFGPEISPSVPEFDELRWDFTDVDYLHNSPPISLVQW